MTVLKKLLRNPSAVAGLFILLLLIIISIVGPFVVQSPYEQDTAMKLLPPSGEHCSEQMILEGMYSAVLLPVPIIPLQPDLFRLF